MADVRNTRQERQEQAFKERGAKLRANATQSPLGDKAGSRRSTTPQPKSVPAANPAPVPSTFSGTQTGLSATPGGLNVSPQELQAIQDAFNAPAAPPVQIIQGPNGPEIVR